MKAAILEKPNRIVVKDIPKRICSEDEVLIKVEACGICGSDLKYYKGENPWALHTLGRHIENPPNIILGHEFTGKVVESGSGRFNHLIGKDSLSNRIIHVVYANSTEPEDTICAGTQNISDTVRNGGIWITIPAGWPNTARYGGRMYTNYRIIYLLMQPP